MGQRIRSSELSDRISQRLIEDLASGIMSPGQHIGAQYIADLYGVSRTPVRDALSQLENHGVLNRQANRGYFVADDVAANVAQWLDEHGNTDTDSYYRLANDWLLNRLPEDVTEQFLRDKYDWTKSKVSELLVRAVREGWAERKEGYGYRFLPVAKTPEAFEQIYRFRLAIEPAGLLEPTFNLDRDLIAEQREIQQWMLTVDLESVPDEKLLANGSLFHEEIIKLSGNPFFLMSLQRVNRMRRLMEYRAEINRDRLIEQCTDHLSILDLLEAGDTVGASYKMKEHLGGALRRKSPLAWRWASDHGSE